MAVTGNRPKYLNTSSASWILHHFAQFSRVPWQSKQLSSSPWTLPWNRLTTCSSSSQGENVWQTKECCQNIQEGEESFSTRRLQETVAIEHHFILIFVLTYFENLHCALHIPSLNVRPCIHIPSLNVRPCIPSTRNAMATTHRTHRMHRCSHVYSFPGNSNLGLFQLLVHLCKHECNEVSLSSEWDIWHLHIFGCFVEKVLVLSAMAISFFSLLKANHHLKLQWAGRVNCFVIVHVMPGF